MEIAINHLTRMSGGICVAGVDLATNSHIRPVLNTQLTFDFLVRNGGPFDIGNIIDLGATTAQPRAPRLEDHLFDQTKARMLRVQTPSDYWSLLNQVCRIDLADIFGTELVLTPTKKAYLPAWTGQGSLGCILPVEPPELFEDWGKLRIKVKTMLRNAPAELNLSPTDIRLYLDDHATYDPAALQLNLRLKSETVILGVGVGYPTAQTAYHPSAHWLQVNAIHFSGTPTWQLG